MGTPTEITCPNPRDPKEKPKKFEFDRVFSPKANNKEVGLCPETDHHRGFVRV